MRLNVIADAIMGVYYNGRPKSQERLDRADFRQLVRAANGEVSRLMYYDERDNADVAEFFAEMVELKEFDIVPFGRERSVEIGIYTLPSGAGIWNIYPVSEDEKDPIDHSKAFAKIKPGSQWIYTKEKLEDTGMNAYMMRGVRPILMCQSCIKRVAIEGIFRDENMEVPDVIGWRIINSVLGPTLKVAGWPIDMTNDNNPNITDIRNRITELQP